jgi:hypothetical protein
MIRQIKFLQSIPGVALATAVVLLVPLIAMQFTDEVNWSVGDFIIMGSLLFGTGVSYVLITRYMSDVAYKAAVGLALGTMLFMIWANLAVGLIGSGPNPGNLMYMAVVAVGIIGAVLSRFKPTGMQRTMFVTAGSLVLHTAIALLTKMDEYPGSSVTAILGVNVFFGFLFLVAGLLFRVTIRDRV